MIYSQTDLLGQTYFVKLDHVRMPNLLQDFNLTSDALNILLIVNLLLLKDLDSNLPNYKLHLTYLFTREDMRSLLHLPKSTFPKCLAYSQSSPHPLAYRVRSGR